MDTPQISLSSTILFDLTQQRNITGWSDVPYDAANFCTLGAALLSFFHCVLLVVCLLGIKSLRTYFNRLILYLAIVGVFVNLNYFVMFFDKIGVIYHLSPVTKGVCIFHAYWMLLSECIQLMWSLWISVHILLDSVFHVKHNVLRKMEIVYHVVNLIPFLYCTALLFTHVVDIDKGVYGATSMWCWITFEYQWARFVFFYALVWFVYTFNLATTIALIIVVVRRKKISTIHKHQIFTGIAFNIAFLASWLFPTVNRIIESATGGPAPYGIQIMQTLTGARSIGFFSFYCLGISRVHHTPQTLEEVMETMIGVRHYIDYFLSRFSPESVFFYLEVEAFKQLPPEEITEAARDIYERYFVLNARLELNIGQASKQLVAERIENQEFSSDMFNRAQWDVLYLLRADFPLFVNSPQYFTLLEELKKKEYSSSRMFITMLYKTIKHQIDRWQRIKVVDKRILEYNKERMQEYLAGNSTAFK